MGVTVGSRTERGVAQNVVNLRRSLAAELWNFYFWCSTFFHNLTVPH